MSNNDSFEVKSKKALVHVVVFVSAVIEVEPIGDGMLISPVSEPNIQTAMFGSAPSTAKLNVSKLVELTQNQLTASVLHNACSAAHATAEKHAEVTALTPPTETGNGNGELN